MTITDYHRTIGFNSETEREKDDFYATDPQAINSLIEQHNIEFKEPILEPACGKGHLSERLKDFGYEVRSMDLIDRGYGETGIDFLAFKDSWNGDIITNPPFKLAQKFIEHSLEIIDSGNHIWMFLKLQYLEGLQRRKLFDRKQLKTVYVFSDRITCDRDCDFTRGSAVAYAWFEFEKGWNKDPILKWLYNKVPKEDNRKPLF